jgi:hypothetical protein
MVNDPELNGKYLGTISADFVKVSEPLREASYHLRKRGISPYPVFPICRHEQPIGALLIPANDVPGEGLHWNYFISFLDEFVQRGIIDADAVSTFEATWKDPDEFCCLFVIDPDFTNFVYIPYPED